MRAGEGRIRERRRLFLLTLMGLGIAGSLMAIGASGPATPGLAAPASSELDIRPAASSDPTETRTAYQAENPGNHLHLSFDSSGLHATPRAASIPAWSLDLSLSTVTYGEHATRPNAPRLSATANRVDFDFGNSKQWYLNTAVALEQGFAIPAPQEKDSVAGAATLSLDLSVGGDLRPRYAPPSYFVDLVAPAGDTVLRYGALSATDANGSSLSTHFETRAGGEEGEIPGIRITIDTGNAAYPIVLAASLRTSAVGPDGVTPPEDDARERVGVPVILAPGITESVGDIMARERSSQPSKETQPREKYPEFEPELVLQEDPNAPAVSHWPPISNPSPAQPSSSMLVGGPDLPQTLGTSFKAVSLPEAGFIPPDSMGDVGPTQIVVHVNGRIRSFTKSGVPDGILDATDTVFWTPVASGGISDPEVRYDRLSGRWFILGITVAESVNNKILVAVSSGPTITGAGSFTFFSFPIGTPSLSDATSFCDYPSLGVDANALYTGCNMFTSAGAFRWTSAFVIRKSSVTGGGPMVVTGFGNITSGTTAGPYSPRGVDNDDPLATEGYIIGTDIALLSRLQIRRVSNPGGTPTLSPNITLTVPTTTNMSSQQASGSTTNVDASDSRLFMASIHKNKLTGVSSLWTAHSLETTTACVGSGSGTTRRIGARWHEIGNLTISPTVTQSGTLCTTATGLNSLNSQRGFLYPSVVETGQGHMALSASFAAATEDVGIASAGRLRTDPLAGTRAPETLLVIGVASYTILDNGGRNRWGDYSITRVDPNDDQTVWTFQEYADARTTHDNWSVRAIQLLAPPPPALATATPVCSGLAATTSTITGTDNCAAPTCSNGLCTGGGSCPEFFDPGLDAGGPGFASHISASVTGGVAVNPFPATGIVIPPTPSTDRVLQVTLSLDTTAATAGTQDITIINPDGQSTTGTALLTILQTPATPAATSNGPICAGQTLQLNAPTVPGATYSWTGPNGFTSSQQNPSIPNATAAAAGTYSVTATANGCTSGAGTVLVTVIATGQTCSDGNACTQTDTCQAGVCTGSNPVVCSASDQCHDAGTCDTGTGVCSNPPKADGITCNDGNACTQTDTCQAGNCAGANPVVCSASDQCHDAGTCDTGTGVCSNPPKPNGTVCEDGNACTLPDTCQSGACLAGPAADLDGDAHVSGLCGGDDCNDTNPLVWQIPAEVTNLTLTTASPADPTWDSQGALAGPETTYDLVSGSFGPGSGILFSAGSCLQSAGPASYSDTRPDPPAGESFWYLSRATNTCGTGTYGSASRDSSIPACP